MSENCHLLFAIYKTISTSVKGVMSQRLISQQFLDQVIRIGKDLSSRVWPKPCRERRIFDGWQGDTMGPNWVEKVSEPGRLLFERTLSRTSHSCDRGPQKKKHDFMINDISTRNCDRKLGKTNVSAPYAIFGRQHCYNSTYKRDALPSGLAIAWSLSSAYVVNKISPSTRTLECDEV